MKSIHFEHAVLVCISALLSLPGCSEEQAPRRERPAKQAPRAAESAAPAPAPTPARAELPGGPEANLIFRTRCVVCHGETGQGNGPGAAALKVKPRNYTDGKWQKSVTDEAIETIVVKGGGAVGKDPGMPPNPDLKDKPAVVQGLRMIVRSFAPKDEPASADAGGATKAANDGKPQRGKVKGK
ncbi:MAG TPA: c-type cytochrome [Polyangiaceae bacterium]|nr:c-type cytochrome [Polyangiaceae bacterium]